MNWKLYTNNEQLVARASLPAGGEHEPGARRNVRIGVSALLLLALLSGCKESIPDVFIIPDRATDRDYVDFQGASYISFQLREKYPATKPILEISDSLKRKGWQPLNQMFLSPENSSSIMTGWNYQEDKKANQFVYEWSADWKDSGNNILNYTFRYIDGMEKYRQSTFVLRPNSDQLKVSATYMPAKVAEVRRRHATASKNE